MKALELAQQYMACFFGEKPLNEMRYLLADDLQFDGPLYHFTSADEYLASLEADPPREAGYRVIHSYKQRFGLFGVRVYQARYINDHGTSV